jgi:hypothetical protein
MTIQSHLCPGCGQPLLAPDGVQFLAEDDEGRTWHRSCLLDVQRNSERLIEEL